MKNISYLFLAVLLGPVSALAQTSPPEPASTAASLKLESPRTESLNQFGVSFQAGFNISVNFKQLGGFAAQGHPVPGQDVQPTYPGPVTGGVENRAYDDGYNWVDSTGNSHPGETNNTTWFWAYDNNDLSQVPGNGTIVMHSTSSAGTAESGGRDDDPALGFQITYRRLILGNDSWRWGIEGAFSYQTLDVHDARAVSGMASQISDTFLIPTGVGDPPKQPGVDGGFFDPGPTLGSEPSRSVDSIATMINGARNFSADIFGFHLGPYWEISLGERVALSLSGGLALAHVSSDFSYGSETVIFQTSTRVAPGGSGSNSDWVAGGYVAGSLLYKVNECWGLFCGVQFQSAGKYSHIVGGKRADLDLGESVFLSIGAAFSF